VCSNYDPVLDKTRLQQFFGVEGQLPLDLKERIWPAYLAPFVRRHEHADVGDEAVPERELMVGSFGMIPHWAKDTKIARTCINARSETVQEKNSFRDAWRWSRHCIIPAEAIFEPDWRTNKFVPTRIVRTDGRPMGIAGLWTKAQIGGETLYSFTMLTINADDHPFMKVYHKPKDEKRMLVILQEEDYGAWLSASPEESREFLRQFPAEMMTVDSGFTSHQDPMPQNGLQPELYR
jgi:putative SOS response-associated peptidase YedK